MKKILSLIITIFLIANVVAQQGIDSLRGRLLNAKDDTTRIMVMNQLAGSYQQSKPDSSLNFAKEALRLSVKTHYRQGEIVSLHVLGDAYVFAGNYPKALEYSLDALKKSEILGNKKLIANSLWAVALAYMGQGDFQQALPYTLRSNEIYEEMHAESLLAKNLVNAGFGYSSLGQLDSSRFCFSKALEISLRIKDEENVAAINLNLGIVHAKMKQYGIAVAYYRQAIPNFVADHNEGFLSSTYYFMGMVYDSIGQTDSALYYSQLAMRHASMMSLSLDLVEMAKQLSALFEKKGRLDSAFVYEKMAMAVTDSLSSREKQKKIQLLTFNEQLRQMEIAEQQRKDAEARERNLELAGIAIFIPSFFFFVLLLSRKKVKSRMIEFLGVLSLLFLFEFIVLFIHPYIGNWTHESQIWMLMILVAIAVVLVPLHHRLERWMKNKLTKGPKKKLQPQTSDPVPTES